MTIDAFSTRLLRVALAALVATSSAVRRAQEPKPEQDDESGPSPAELARQIRRNMLKIEEDLVQGRDARPLARRAGQEGPRRAARGMKQRQDQVVKDIDDIVKQIKISNCNSGGQGSERLEREPEAVAGARPQPVAEPGKPRDPNGKKPGEAEGRAASPRRRRATGPRTTPKKDRTSGRERSGRSAQRSRRARRWRTSTSTRSGATCRPSSARSSSIATSTTSLLSTRSRSRSTSGRRGRLRRRGPADARSFALGSLGDRGTDAPLSRNRGVRRVGALHVRTAGSGPARAALRAALTGPAPRRTPAGASFAGRSALGRTVRVSGGSPGSGAAPLPQHPVHVALQVPALRVGQHHRMIGRLRSAMEELEPHLGFLGHVRKHVLEIGLRDVLAARARDEDAAVVRGPARPCS